MSYKCCRCNKRLHAQDTIFADKKGVLSIKGKPHCAKCLPGNDESGYDFEETPEERIDKLTEND